MLTRLSDLPVQSSFEQFLGSPKLLPQYKFYAQIKYGAALEQFCAVSGDK